MVDRSVLLLVTCALACYNVGTIWAHEVDIFRSWRLVPPEAFRRVQGTHWRKLPYWVFIPAGLTLIGSVALLWYHPVWSPRGALFANLGCQLLAYGLTGAFWGRWQAELSRDALGPESPFLVLILRTHWVRTALITGSALCLLLALRVGLPG